MVTIWEKPNCPNCKIVKGVLRKEGIDFQIKQIFNDAGDMRPEPKNLMEVHELKAAPIVQSDHIVFGGLDKTKLDELIDWERVWD